MQLKEDIELMLEAALKDRDSTKPMDEMAWGYNQGAIDQLEWVLKREQMGGADIKKLTAGANNDTIKRALKRLHKQYGFGEKNETKISKEQRETITELC